LAVGGIGFILRLCLFAFCVDDKGLLMAGHPLGITVYILTVLFMAALLLRVRGLQAAVPAYRKLFPGSLLSAIGCIAAGAGILFTAADELILRRDMVTMITAILALLACVSLILLGLHRKKGQRPSYLLHTGVTVYMMFHLISQYRLWSPEPQLQIYFFPLLASVFLMLTAYQAVCLDIKKGDRRAYVFFNQAALFCSCLSLVNENWLFYLTMGIWTATNLCSFRPAKTETPPEQKQTEE